VVQEESGEASILVAANHWIMSQEEKRLDSGTKQSRQTITKKKSY
jgi:hypothetical protein